MAEEHPGKKLTVIIELDGLRVGELRTVVRKHDLEQSPVIILSESASQIPEYLRDGGAVVALPEESQLQAGGQELQCENTSQLILRALDSIHLRDGEPGILKHEGIEVLLPPALAALAVSLVDKLLPLPPALVSDFPRKVDVPDW